MGYGLSAPGGLATDFPMLAPSALIWICLVGRISSRHVRRPPRAPRACIAVHYRADPASKPKLTDLLCLTH